MNLTIPEHFPVERIQRALSSEGLAIRTELKHGEPRHVLTEAQASRQPAMCVECQTFPPHGITDRCRYCGDNKYVGE